MQKVHTYLIVVIGVGVATAGLLFFELRKTNNFFDAMAQGTWTSPRDSLEAVLKRMRMKPAPRVVKGVYLTASSAGNPKKLDDIIALIDRTELNAVVIDIKDYTGHILYDSGVPLARELHLSTHTLGDVPALIKKLHSRGIYAIARQTVFQDPMLARTRPEWAMKDIGGGLWRDYKGLSWVDPAQREVWDYNIAIAREAMRLGFDEINFDYVRFPSDGNLSRVASLQGGKKKYEVMGQFFRTMWDALSRDSARVSFDLFGFAMEKTGEDDMNIGQRLTDVIDAADAISPMMYPSHYPRGHLGLANPAAFPAMVIEHGLQKGMPVFAGHHAKLRPWLQAFDLGAVYDGAKIRAEIDAVEKYSHDGWLLWNASNRYTDAGLRLDAQK